jgi:integrase
MAIENRSGRWGYRFNLSGREYRVSTGLEATRENRKTAEQAEAKAKLEAMAGIEKPRTTLIPFPEAAEEFVKWCFTTEYRSRPSTAHRIKTSFASLAVFFDQFAVGSITPLDVERYKTWRITDHGVKDVTLRHDLHALSLFFKRYAIKAGWAVDSPVTNVKKPGDSDAIRIHFITPEEEARYFEHARGNIADLARLMLDLGCRPEEILSLNKDRGDVDLTAAQIHIRGGKSRAAKRSIDLTERAHAILERRIQIPGKWIFPSPRYPDRHMIKLNNRHDEICREAGVSFVLYDFRHTFATRMLTEVKLDVKALSEIMGHSSITVVLKHYVHPQSEVKRAAMKAYEEKYRPQLKRIK